MKKEKKKLNKCCECGKEAVIEIDHRQWCDKCCNKFLRSPEAQKHIIAVWDLAL